MELIRKTTDCALRCLTVMAKAPGKQLVSVRKLVEQGDISEDLLHKIMQALRQAKLVRATRGRTGGFRLAKPASKITVLKVLEVLQGRSTVSNCFQGSNRRIHKKFVNIQEELFGMLRGLTIADLADRDGKPTAKRGRKRK